MKTAFPSSLLSITLLLTISNTVFAQAEIRSSTAQPTQEAAAPATPVNSAANTNATLVFELQTLQQEVLQLRGLLEKQNHEIKRLKQQRLDDYLDLDKRISELLANQGQQNTTPATAPTLPEVATTDPAVDLNAVVQADEKALYSEAIDSLLNKQDYQQAQNQFTQYLETYPQGKYVPNVYYWQGQIVFAGGKKDQATELFQKLIDQYPTHAKAPDAKFKLARIYFDDGKKDEAKVLFDEVAASDSDAALLAKSFIAKNY